MAKRNDPTATKMTGNHIGCVRFWMERCTRQLLKLERPQSSMFSESERRASLQLSTSERRKLHGLFSEQMKYLCEIECFLVETIGDPATP